MITLKTWKIGIANGFKTALIILKIIIPIYAAVTILGHTPVMEWVSKVFSPMMNFLGLPGESAIAFVTGAFISIYASIGIIMALDLTPWQITTMAVMINFSHDLFVETALLKRIGIDRVWSIFMIRLISAFLIGGLMNLMPKFCM